MKYLILTLLCCVTLLDAYFISFDISSGQLWAEICITLLFAGYYCLTSKFKRKTIFFALLFLGLGDLFLNLETPSYMLQWGVFFYWVMQLLLLIEFIRFPNPLRYSIREHSLGILFYASYFIIFMNHVYASLGNMKWHGLVYGITLSLFGSLTLMKLLKLPNRENGLLFFGLLLFSVRDVLLTYNKRYFEDDVFTYPIPLFHVIGFYFMVSAFIKKEEIVFSMEAKNPI